VTRFPSNRPANIAEFQAGYFEDMGRALSAVTPVALERAAAMLATALHEDRQIFLAGNGGSAAIANHLVADYAKNLRGDTSWKPRVRSLSGSHELITAIGNDLSYADVFAYQLQGFGRPGDLLVTVSSSGESENIVRAIDWAKANSMGTIALTGFGGGRSSKLADVNLHVDSQNYGVVEDLHQSLLHMLGQWVRMTQMPDALIAERKF
jgi:D-sedoheptulose 7-phosphate isomerase